jgi:hypothetical protein
MSRVAMMPAKTESQHETISHDAVGPGGNERDDPSSGAKDETDSCISDLDCPRTPGSKFSPRERNFGIRRRDAKNHSSGV